MLLTNLILIPFIGIFLASVLFTYNTMTDKIKLLKITALAVSILDLIISLIIYILYDNSNKNFQFVQEHYEMSYYEFYLGLDGLSIYFVILTTLIMPIALLSNWKSLKIHTTIFLWIIMMLEASLLTVFLVLDILMFYIFFESILAPLFILIGIYGSSEKVRASFYFFLYTLLGSLFMLLSIISVLSLIGSTSFDILSKTNFVFITQVFFFIGIFIAFAVKTPVIYLNSWLLKAHVESPLSGSIILAAIVLKLSLYGIFRLMLVLLPKAFLYYTYIIFIIGVLTIVYASLSTIRTIDVKELIAYSSVSHAAVYLIGAFSNAFQGIQGAICLGLAHGFVSSGLFISAGGILYDRSSTRLITYYRGIAQIMPIFCTLFFILSLGNCGVPLTFNFLGEFLSLYGVFERLPMAGVLASSSIVFSAAYTIFMYNRIAFAGSYFLYYWNNYLPDINKREFFMLLTLVLFTVILGIYPAIILDGLHYSTYSLLFLADNFSTNSLHFDANNIILLDEVLHNMSQDSDDLITWDEMLHNVYNEYSFSENTNYMTSDVEIPMHGVRCPECLKKDQTVWVIPGTRCHKCGHAC
jgi:NADH-ubiquinone oxidoreductase chain 4